MQLVLHRTCGKLPIFCEVLVSPAEVAVDVARARSVGAELLQPRVVVLPPAWHPTSRTLSLEQLTCKSNALQQGRCYVPRTKPWCSARSSTCTYPT